MDNRVNYIIGTSIILIMLSFFAGTWVLNDDQQITWSISFLLICFVVLIITVNYSVLLPNYLQNGNWIKYLLSVTIFLFIVSPIKVTAVHLMSWFSLEDQLSTVREQGLYYLADILVVFLSTVVHLSTTWVWQKRRMDELEKQNIQTEMKFLKAQINPHFLFNTLNNIYALSLKNHPSTPEIVLKLSGILRYILYECNDKEVTLEKEWNSVENYITIEKLRHSRPVDIEINAGIEFPGFKIAPLILMTFIENAFKHGIKKSHDSSFIKIRLEQKSERDFLFEISNSKQKMSNLERKPVITDASGIGYKNVKKRLQLIYPEQHSLIKKETKDTYSIILKINKK